MEVYRYWSWSSVNRHVEGSRRKRWLQKIWVGSDESEAAAAALAAVEVERLAGTPVPTNRHKQRGRPGSYRYSEGGNPEPLLDEVLDDAGDRAAAVTRNRYGALVLNTRDVGFIDVDDDWPANPRTGEFNENSLTASLERPARGGFFGELLDRFFGKRPPSADAIHQASMDALTSWVTSGSGRGVRVYRTAGGLRYMMVNPRMSPVGDETRSLMEMVGADPAYARLCRVQRSFRARLTAKPWRIESLRKMSRPNFPREELLWPSPASIARIKAYDAAASGYAVCRLLEEIGDARPADVASLKMVAMHDEMCGVGTDLPLA